MLNMENFLQEMENTSCSTQKQRQKDESVHLSKFTCSGESIEIDKYN